MIENTKDSKILKIKAAQLANNIEEYKGYQMHEYSSFSQVSANNQSIHSQINISVLRCSDIMEIFNSIPSHPGRIFSCFTGVDSIWNKYHILAKSKYSDHNLIAVKFSNFSFESDESREYFMELHEVAIRTNFYEKKYSLIAVQYFFRYVIQYPKATQKLYNREKESLLSLLINTAEESHIIMKRNRSFVNTTIIKLFAWSFKVFIVTFRKRRKFKDPICKISCIHSEFLRYEYKEALA